jgi:hypothetical protein
VWNTLNLFDIDYQLFTCFEWNDLEHPCYLNNTYKMLIINAIWKLMKIEKDIRWNSLGQLMHSARNKH